MPAAEDLLRLHKKFEGPSNRPDIGLHDVQSSLRCTIEQPRQIATSSQLIG